RSRYALVVDVLAKGYAPVFFAVAADGGTRERPLQVGLSKSASLRGVVLGPDRRPTAGVKLMVQFNRLDLRRPRPALGSVLESARGQCEVETASTGEFAFTGLPADVELTLTAGSDEEEMRYSTRFLWLEPGEERELRWTLAPAGSVSGRVVGADGAPLADATV